MAPGTPSVLGGLGLAGILGYFAKFTNVLSPPAALYEWPSDVDPEWIMQLPAGIEPGQLLMLTKPDGTEVPWTVPDHMKYGDYVSLETLKKQHPTKLYWKMTKAVGPNSSLELLAPNGSKIVKALPDGAALDDVIVLEEYDHGVGALLFKLLPYAAVMEFLIGAYVVYACAFWSKKDDDKGKTGEKDKKK